MKALDFFVLLGVAWLQRSVSAMACYIGYVLYHDLTKKVWKEVVEEQRTDVVSLLQKRGVSPVDYYYMSVESRKLTLMIEKADRFSISDFRSILIAQRKLSAVYTKVTQNG